MIHAMWTTVYTCVCVVLVQPTYTTESAQPFDGCAGLLPSAVQKGTDHQTNTTGTQTSAVLCTCCVTAGVSNGKRVGSLMLR